MEKEEGRGMKGNMSEGKGVPPASAP